MNTEKINSQKAKVENIKKIIEANKREGFTVMPHDIFDVIGSRAVAGGIWMYLQSFLQENAPTPSPEDIAKHFSVSLSSVKKDIKFLKSLSLLDGDF